MIVVRITSQLANQMFAYASIKSIAKDKGYKFRYIHEYCNASEISYSTADKKYGRDFDTIFPIPKKEELKSLDNLSLTEHEEYEYIKKYDSFYYKEAIEIKDNTYMKGHFICPKYFIHRINEVRQWFQFPKEIDEKSSKLISNIRNKNLGKKIISVHFRVGQDYLLHGFLMKSAYWINAAEKAQKKFGNVKYIVFCDKQTKIVNQFLKKYDCEIIRGSLVEDLCSMTKCDAHILSNSTFSMMGALLDPKNGYTIRPSHYFTGPRTEQKDCFLDDWDVVDSQRDYMSFLFSTLRLGSIRNKLFDLIHKNRT